MKKYLKAIFAVLAVMLIITAVSLPAFAADGEETTAAATQEAQEAASSDSTTKAKAYAAAIMIAAVASAGAVAMAISIKSGSNNIARQPEAAGNIRTNVMLGLVFIETAIIYALIVAILLIFVL